MKTLLIVRLGSTFSWLSEKIGDFDDWIVGGIKEFSGRIEFASPFLGEPLPPLHGISGMILTGSHSMVTSREQWSEETAIWLREALDLGCPILGICYGHQLLAHAAGGVVGYNPKGDEFGTTGVRLANESSNDRLFRVLPSPLTVQVCHAQSVLEPPPGAIILASNDHDPHHAFRIGRNAWGVQFHPEFSPEAMKAYIEHYADELRTEGRDPERLLWEVGDTPAANSLLDGFANFVEAF